MAGPDVHAGHDHPALPICTTPAPDIGVRGAAVRRARWLNRATIG